jgi:hypothetical protein
MKKRKPRSLLGFPLAKDIEAARKLAKDVDIRLLLMMEAVSK